MEVMLGDNGLKKFIEQDIPKPPASDEKYLDECKKRVARVRQIILEGLRPHFLKSSWEGESVCYVENIYRHFP